MLDFGFSEILLTSAIALVVLGPERLPKVARQVGNWMGRARAMARQLSEQLEREVDADELLKMQTRKLEAPLATRIAPPQSVPQPQQLAAPLAGHEEYTPPDPPESSPVDQSAVLGGTHLADPHAGQVETQAHAANGSGSSLDALATPTPSTEVPVPSAAAFGADASRVDAHSILAAAPESNKGIAPQAATPVRDPVASEGWPADEATVPLLRALSPDAEPTAHSEPRNPRNPRNE